jgi:hypothetical protein
MKKTVRLLVFSTLDETAGKTEALLLKIKLIIGCGSCRYCNYWLFSVSKFIAEPKQLEAADEMFVAQQNFQQATDGMRAIHYINYL